VSVTLSWAHFVCGQVTSRKSEPHKSHSPGHVILKNRFLSISGTATTRTWGCSSWYSACPSTSISSKRSSPPSGSRSTRDPMSSKHGTLRQSWPDTGLAFQVKVLFFSRCPLFARTRTLLKQALFLPSCDLSLPLLL